MGLAGSGQREGRCGEGKENEALEHEERQGFGRAKWFPGKLARKAESRMNAASRA